MSSFLHLVSVLQTLRLQIMNILGLAAPAAARPQRKFTLLKITSKEMIATNSQMVAMDTLVIAEEVALGVPRRELACTKKRWRIG